METRRLKSVSLWLLVIFFIVAGINHFRDPEFYYPLIPNYLPFHGVINISSGVFEVLFGIGIIFKFTRRYAAYGILLMLIAFIPSHLYFIEIGGCVPNGLCVPLWLAWLRLLLIHPLFMLWVWRHRT